MPRLEPVILANEAIYLLGQHAKIIGSLGDGSPAAEATRYHYGQVVQAVLRAAHWNFARKNAQLQMLADVTGMTIAPESNQPISSAVEPPWTYAYGWPVDCVKPRWMPALSLDEPMLTVSAPLMTNMSSPIVRGRQIPPARFLVSTSDEFPQVVGEADWDTMPDLHGTVGSGIITRQVILSNVRNATLTYTALVLEIELWDAMFRHTVVSALAERLAAVVIDDPKLAHAAQLKWSASAKAALAEARTANANEAGFPQSLNREASWIGIRRRGGGYGGWPGFDRVDAPGMTYCGWDSMSWADGSVF